MTKTNLLKVSCTSAAIVFFSRCTPHYQIVDFSSVTADHITIAILPVEMVFTGVLPEDWTREDQREIGEAESKTFQMAFYNELLRSTKSGRKPLKVTPQPYRRTLQLLEDSEISVTRSWRLDPQEIAMLLNVDAVVQARIVKTRFMSDLASYGIDVATHIVNLVTNYYVSPWLPYATRSKEIDAEYSLISKDGGEVLWSISFSEGADWRQPSKEIIDGISRRAARYFPYRK